MKPQSPEQLHVTVRYPNIAPSQLAEFKQATAELIEISRSEPGTLRYDFYFNDAETVCVVHELFADSAACLSHIVGVGSRLGRLMILGGGMEVECFGTPTPDLLAASTLLSPIIFTLMDGK